MEAHRLLTVLILGVALLGCSVASKPVASQNPWSHHCSAKGIPTRDAEEAAYLDAAAARCEPVDACLLACNRSGCAENIGGRCAHACFPGTPENLVKRADRWASRPSCRLPPNNSFKPKPLRGSA
jgi:hypothetical protein